MIRHIPRSARSLFTIATTAFALSLGGTAHAQANNMEAMFDRTLGTEVRAPQTYEARYDTAFEQQIARLADGSNGRIGVYAIDLATGQDVGVLADHRFPLASTSKVAIAATFLAGVDQGRWSLTSEFPLPGRGTYMSAQRHLELMISKSCNACTDALLNAVGGPTAVNAYMQRIGITDFTLSRSIAALVREDGDVDPATTIDVRDSATPRAMGRLLAGIHEGRWHTPRSRAVLMNAMKATTTGKKRMPSGLPMMADLAHKTGTLSRTASDIGIFRLPDGRTVAAAIYVTGQSASMAAENGNRARKLEARRVRDGRIASITSALYNGFARSSANARNWANAQYGNGGQ